MGIVCGMTAGAADSKISNQPVTFESNRKRPIRIRIESRIFAGPYIWFWVFMVFLVFDVIDCREEVITLSICLSMLESFFYKLF